MIKLSLRFFLLLAPLQIIAQSFTPNPDWRFDNFNNQNHFTSKIITNVTIDKLGYVWTSGEGLQRFDGSKTVQFDSYNQGAGEIKNNYTDLITDNSGRVWISSAGLCYYNNNDGKFIYVQPDSGRTLTYAFAFCVKNNNLWFVCNYGLAKLNLITLKISVTSLKVVTDPIITFSADDNTLLVSSRLKLYVYHIRQNTYQAKTIVVNHTIVAVYSAEKVGDVFYLGTRHGLYTIKKLDDVTAGDNRTPDVEVDDLKFLPGDTKKEHLFLGTDGHGITVFNTRSQKIEFNYKHDDNNPYSIPSDIVSKFYIDKLNRVWMATGMGISMLDFSNQQFKMRFIDRKNTAEQSTFGIAADRYDKNKVWMIAEERGLLNMDWQTKQTRQVFNDSRLLRLHDFVQLSKNDWLLNTGKVLFEFNLFNGITRTEKLPIPDSLSLRLELRKIIRYDSTNYFLATNIGLFKYNLLSHAVTIASKTGNVEKQRDLVNGFNDNGTLWLAARNGLLSYDAATGHEHLYRGNKSLDNFLFDCAPVDDNRIVCATAIGISIFDKRTKTLSAINKLANLTNLTCVSVTCVNHVIWIGNATGLISYNLATGKSANVGNDNPGMEIFPVSKFAVINNVIALGLRKGYAYFTPTLKKDLIPSNPVIENIAVNNHSLLSYIPNGNNRDNLTFTHTDNSIDIYFASFMYSEPLNLSFRYMLKGADNSWQYAKDQRSANYAQLEPGSYTFYVQSSNKNGEWNPHTATVSFVIKPPFWATWWFMLLCVLAVAFCLYQLYLYKINHMKNIEHIRQSIASDFHDDLGSTLSSISIFSEVAIQKAETDMFTTKNMIGDIGVRARSMIHSMNDMVWTIKPENDNLFKLMQRMQEFSYPVAEAKEIQLVFLMDEVLYQVKTDMVRRKNLFLIFKEAFNNAVKYSSANKIEVMFLLKNKKTLLMQIADNGCGFDNNQKKQGNGLVNMQKRAAEIKGKLKIVTTAGAGTSICIQCKIT